MLTGKLIMESFAVNVREALVMGVRVPLPLEQARRYRHNSKILASSRLFFIKVSFGRVGIESRES